MHKARSGLAAAAARWQLVDAPEGESSLQSRLQEAERRAQDAEASAQDAQAALTRTLLDAARVEAVVTARIKAQSDAEIDALRTELETMKQATSALEQTLHGDGTQREAAEDGATTSPPAEPAPEAPPDTSVASCAADAPAVPAVDDMAAAEATAAEATAGEAASGETPPDADAPDQDADQDPDQDIAPELRIADADRPEWADVPEAVVAESRLLRVLPPARIAFLAVVGIVAVISYFVTTDIMESPAPRTVVAGGAGPDAVEGVLQDTGTDAKSIAAASAALDAELTRLQALSRKVESLRTVLAVRQRADGRPTPAATRAVAADRVSPTPQANWLLYMPVERAALVDYLAGRSWPGIQMAAKAGKPPVRQR